MKARKYTTTDKFGVKIEAKEEETGDGQVKIRKLSDFLLAIVDRIRMINPTTNNKISSRSHDLIYIQIREGNVPAGKIIKTLCVGDLAGVENTFNCNLQSTQAAFLNLEATDRNTSQKIIRTDSAGNEMFENNDPNKPIYRTEPWYTRKVKELVEIPGVDTDAELERILNNYLKYDYKKKIFFDEDSKIQFDGKIKWMQLACAHDMFARIFIIDYKDMIQKDLEINITDTVKENIKDAIAKKIAAEYQIKINAWTGKTLNFSSPYNFYTKYVYNGLEPTNEAERKLWKPATIQIIQTNNDIFTSSGVEGLCNERKFEGKFINRSLKGMKADLTNIVDKLSDDGLIKNIKLVHGSCFKYHCNKYNAGCFGHLYKK